MADNLNLTLQQALREDVCLHLNEDDNREINLRLMLLIQLSSLQMNIAQEIEQIYNAKAKYKMTIKHNHEKLKNHIRQNTNNAFWKGLTQEQIDAICEDADTLEEIIKDWCGINRETRTDDNANI